MNYSLPRTNRVSFTNTRGEAITLHLRSAELAERMAQTKGGTWTKEV